jgi:hypothetical protein
MYLWLIRYAPITFKSISIDSLGLTDSATQPYKFDLEQECCLSKEEERVASKELKLENTKAIIQSILQSHKADSILSISRTVLQDIPGHHDLSS